MFPRKKGRLKMFDIAYEAEANIEAANIIIEKEWERSINIKNPANRALYVGAACLYPSSVWKYWNIIFLTHGGF